MRLGDGPNDARTAPTCVGAGSRSAPGSCKPNGSADHRELLRLSVPGICQVLQVPTQARHADHERCNRQWQHASGGNAERVTQVRA